MIRSKRLLQWGAILIAVTGCTRFCGRNRRDLTPEQVIEGYLDTSLNMSDVSQRQNLLLYTTGNLRSAIASVSDDTIKQAYIDRKFEIVSFSVLEKKDRTPREMEITFQLNYKDLGKVEEKIKSADAPDVITENTVSLVKEKETWYIRDVLGQKTAIDFPLAQGARIQAKPGDNTPDEPSEDDEGTPPATEPGGGVVQ